MSATVTISIEIELAWGHHDVVGGVHPTLSEGRTAETTALERLLDRCDRHDLPLSFDVVGHLLHEDCSGSHEGPHDADWFAADPGTNSRQDPHFYAPDLVAAVRDRPTEHEICTHSYSHVLCDEVPAGVVDWELARSGEVHEGFGLDSPKSFVPPRHQSPPRKPLADNGIEIVRTPFPEYSVPDGSRLSRIAWLLRRSHPLGGRRRDDGLIETYCTPHPSLTAEYLPVGKLSPHPVFRAIPSRLRRRWHAAYLADALDRAIAADADLHLWTHLYNLVDEHQWAVVEEFLDRLAASREAGDATVRTMAALADEPLANEGGATANDN
jgi:hypothetical protein